MVNFEQVQKLRDRANISYEEAKKALEETNGDLLQAMINLEKQNKIKAPEAGGYYNSQGEQQGGKGDGRGHRREKKSAAEKDSSFKEQVSAFFKWCGKIIHKGNINNFEVLKEDRRILMLPVTALVLLILFAFWLVVPLIIIGLFFGYRYHFLGPDLDKPEVNRVMDSVADASVRAKDSVVNAVDNLAKEANTNKGEASGANSDH